MSQAIDETQILNRLQRVIQGRIAVDPESLSLGAKLSEVGVDSFSLVELIFVAEEESGIKMPFEGMVVNTVKDVVSLIARQVAIQHPP